MSSNFTIHAISLKNFRCHCDVTLGPFCKFNLVYGRNGSGKTSLLEAIQLGLTGSSNRAGADSVARDIVACNPDEEVRIDICTDGTGFSSFRNGTMSPSRTDILLSFYGVKAAGPKARSLLNQLFERHNILYSEQIIQLLASGNSEGLRKIVQELVLGREVLDTWQRLEAARSSIEKERENLSSKHSATCADLEKLHEAIKAIQEKSKVGLESDLQELWKRLPLGIKAQGFEKPPKIGSQALSDLNQISTTIQEVVDHITNLRGFCGLKEEIPDWTVIHPQLEQTKTDYSSTLKEISEKEDKLQPLQEQLTETEEELKRKHDEQKELLQQLQSLGGILPRLQNIIEWLPELNAEAQSEATNAEKRKLRRELARMEKAEAVTKKLPSTQAISKLETDLLDMSAAKKTCEEELEQITDRIRTINGEIEVINEISKAAASENERLHSIVLRLSDTISDYWTLRKDNICPTCGTPWESVERLESAINDRLESITSELTTQRDIYPEHAQKLTEMKKERYKLDEEVRERSERLKGLNQNIGTIDSEMKETANMLSEFEELLHGSKVVASIHDSDLASRLSDVDHESLRARIEEIRGQLSRCETRLHALWTGLRKQDFDVRKDSLDDEIASVRDGLSRYFEIPKEYESTLWRDLRASAEQFREELEPKVSALEDDIKTLKSKKIPNEKDIQDLRKEIERLRYLNEAGRKRIDELSEVDTRIQTLKKLGVIDEVRQANIEGVLDDMIQLNRRFQGLKSAIEEDIDNMNERELLSDNLEELAKQKEELFKDLNNIDKYLSRFKELDSPESHERDVWKDYSDTISQIFSKLHWPPDFQEVRLHSDTEKDQIEVHEKRPPNRWVPAVDRLSSGQRAALAISVFWALNSRHDNVPKLLLMDEPIQNVDDLNILNFLDVMRWLVEIGNRQVFLTTANQRVAGLIRRKFSYLENDFLEVNMTRETAYSQTTYYDWQGNNKMEDQDLSVG